VRRRARLLPVVVAVAILAATVVARFATTNAHADVLAVLQGRVGPDFAISLKNPDGRVVSHLNVGEYQILVNDQATNHNYHLEGPGVTMATGIPDVQTADWTVTLGDGVFTYHCDQHLGLTANFAVGTATLAPPPAPAAPILIAPAPSPTPAPAPAPAPAPSLFGTPAGTLRAALAGAKLTLTLNGKPLTKNLASGTYRVVAVDSSKTGGLTLAHVGAKQQALTTASFTGTKTVTLDLSSGRWTVYSAGSGASRPFTVSR
jgi:hypothetical protein